MLNSHQIAQFFQDGHLTVGELFSAAEVADALDDLQTWSREVARNLKPEQRRWYLEQSDGPPVFRKLDHPVFHRAAFRQLACAAPLLAMVEQLIGGPAVVFFSQVFCKPPEVGGPKPVHQDNFYFGPDQPDALLTAWIALDEATTTNGCLQFATERPLEVLPHFAPADQPFNLQIAADLAARFRFEPAPVPSGGVSFHHGNALHTSAANRSPLPRRAVAMHYLRTDARLIQPALPFDESMVVAALAK